MTTPLQEFVIECPTPAELESVERGPLKIFMSEPTQGVDEKTVPILVLHGFGGLSLREYLESLHRSVSDKMNAVVITLDYLGATIMRPQMRLELDKFAFDVTNQMLRKIGVGEIPEAALRHPNKERALIQSLKKIRNQLNKFGAPILRLSQRELHDHNDFGLVQAIDSLWAVKLAKEKYPSIDWSRLTAAGMSHGAYVATQCARFAPNSFSLVLNAYGWTDVYLDWLIQGRRWVDREIEGLNASIATNNYWTLNKGDPNELDSSRQAIRSQTNFEQLKQWRANSLNSPTHFLFTQQVNDNLHPIEEKLKMLARWKEAQIPYSYVEQSEENKSKYRSLTDLSLKGFILDFAREEFWKNHLVKEDDFERKSVVQYKTESRTYEIDFSQDYPKLKIL